MTETIKNIFEKNSTLLGLIDKAVIHFREGAYDLALSVVADSVEGIREITEAVIEDREYFNLVSTESVMEMISGIVDAQRSKDFILLSDLLELQLITFICSVQSLIINKEDYNAFDSVQYERSAALLLKQLEQSVLQSTGISETEKAELLMETGCRMEEGLNPQLLLEKGYRVEFTSCGMMTLGVTDTKGSPYYMHTNHKVLKEAYLIARSWYQKDAQSYVIFGLGLGYMVKELLTLSEDRKVKIVAYEPDINVIKLACAFSDMDSLVLNPQFSLCYDPNYQMIRKELEETQEGKVVCVFYPALRRVEDAWVKERLMDNLSWARKVEGM